VSRRGIRWTAGTTSSRPRYCLSTLPEQRVCTEDADNVAFSVVLDTLEEMNDATTRGRPNKRTAAFFVVVAGFVLMASHWERVSVRDFFPASASKHKLSLTSFGRRTRVFCFSQRKSWSLPRRGGGRKTNGLLWWRNGGSRCAATGENGNEKMCLLGAG